MDDAGVVTNAGGLGSAALTPVAVDALSPLERIQLRVEHPIATDFDRANDYHGYYSANNSSASRRPRLVVEYID